jgi:hypothetical protein
VDFGGNSYPVFIKFDQAGCQRVILRLRTPRYLYQYLGAFSLGGVVIQRLEPMALLRRQDTTRGEIPSRLPLRDQRVRGRWSTAKTLGALRPESRRGCSGRSGSTSCDKHIARTCDCG